MTTVCLFDSALFWQVGTVWRAIEQSIANVACFLICQCYITTMLYYQGLSETSWSAAPLPELWFPSNLVWPVACSTLNMQIAFCKRCLSNWQYRTISIYTIAQKMQFLQAFKRLFRPMVRGVGGSIHLRVARSIDSVTCASAHRQQMGLLSPFLVVQLALFVDQWSMSRFSWNLPHCLRFLDYSLPSIS